MGGVTGWRAGGSEDITLRLLDALVVVGVLPAKFRQRFREDGVVQATAADQRLSHFEQLADQQVLHLCPDVSKENTDPSEHPHSLEID